MSLFVCLNRPMKIIAFSTFTSSSPDENARVMHALFGSMHGFFCISSLRDYYRFLSTLSRSSGFFHRCLRNLLLFELDADEGLWTVGSLPSGANVWCCLSKEMWCGVSVGKLTSLHSAPCGNITSFASFFFVSSPFLKRPPLALEMPLVADMLVNRERRSYLPKRGCVWSIDTNNNENKRVRCRARGGYPTGNERPHAVPAHQRAQSSGVPP